MRRIVTVMVVVIVVAAGVRLTTTSDVSAGATGRDRPNILFILTDDMAKSDLSAMPHVRSLLTEQGTTF